MNRTGAIRITGTGEQSPMGTSRIVHIPGSRARIGVQPVRVNHGVGLDPASDMTKPVSQGAGGLL